MLKKILRWKYVFYINSNLVHLTFCYFDDFVSLTSVLNSLALLSITNHVSKRVNKVYYKDKLQKYDEWKFDRKWLYGQIPNSRVPISPEKLLTIFKAKSNIEGIVKMAKHGCDREKSRVWTFPPMPKWSIFPFQMGHLELNTTTWPVFDLLMLKWLINLEQKNGPFWYFRVDLRLRDSPKTWDSQVLKWSKWF